MSTLTCSKMNEFEELDELFTEFGICEEVEVAKESEDEQEEWGEGEEAAEDQIDRIQERVENFVRNMTSESEGEDDTEQQCDNNENTQSCTCKTNCKSEFSVEQIESHRLNLNELEKAEKEMFLMGSLSKVDGDETRSGKRKRTRYRYMHDGKPVCKAVFCYINDVGDRVLKNLKKHMALHGAVPRVHGNLGRKPSHALQYAEIRYAVDWILWFANINGLPMPAAPRGQDGEAPILLPTHTTKKALHSQYVGKCTEDDVRALGLTSFKNVWSNCIPHVRIMSPKDDVCHKCQTYRNAVSDAVTEATKITAATVLREHVIDGQRERQAYLDSVKAAEEEFAELVIERPDGPVPPMSSDLQKVHYTFDFMQNVCIPHHSQQMGPLYFVSGRKLQVFGVRVDSTKHQYNYIIDENQSIGEDGKMTHGPNAILSMLHHSIFRYGLGERNCVLHADNAGGQNKNKYTVAYLAWRVMSHLHDGITLMMAIPGHTKCLVDGGFGRIKKVFRRSDCDTLEQFAGIVDRAGQRDVPVLFSDRNNEQNWIWYDWKQFLERYFLPVKGIQKYHSFRVATDAPGTVFLKKRSTDEEKAINIMRRGVVVPPHEMPAIVQPAGMSRARQLYLHKKVRPYVRPCFRDTTCPLPPEE